MKRIPKLFTLHSSLFIVTAAGLLLLTACSDKERSKSLTEGGMKCGAGKCGASMANGSALLVKKKMNILNQLKKDDKRRDCVLKAPNTKTLYDCVRDKESGRLTIHVSSQSQKNPQEKRSNDKSVKSNKVMKCESGKCSGGK
jgi:hypothetical protein